jgi:hypothetical protein
MGVSGLARFVFVMLDAHANKRGEAWPSVATLARGTGFGTTKVRAALRELVDAKLVSATVVKGHPTVYTLSFFTFSTPTPPVDPPQHTSVDPTPTRNGTDPNTFRGVPQHTSVDEGIEGYEAPEFSDGAETETQMSVEEIRRRRKEILG